MSGLPWPAAAARSQQEVELRQDTYLLTAVGKLPGVQVMQWSFSYHKQVGTAMADDGTPWLPRIHDIL